MLDENKIQEILDDLEIIENGIISSSSDDGHEQLKGLRDFIKEEPILLNYIKNTMDKVYTSDEIYPKDDYERYSIPARKEGRIGFTWSLINNWIDNNNPGDYFNIGFAYGNGSSKVDTFVEGFHAVVIKPFITIIKNYLKSELPSSTNGNVIVNSNNSNVAVQYQSNGSVINVGPEIGKLMLDAINELNESNYVNKDQLISLINIVKENPNARYKDKSFLIMLKEKLDPYLTLITTSDYVLKFSNKIAEWLSNLS